MSRDTLAPMTTTAIRAEPITERSAVDLAAAIRRGELRSREVVDAHIELIERRNPAITAIVATRFDAGAGGGRCGRCASRRGGAG